MKGYQIIEARYLKTYRVDGMEPYETRIGMLDFLRELKAGPEHIPRCAAFQVVGFDEVLYLSHRSDQEGLALAMRRLLQDAASKLDQKFVEVQIVCKGRLIPGDSLWLEFRGETFPMDLIFGTPTKKILREDIPVYETGFNLSS